MMNSLGRISNRGFITRSQCTASNVTSNSPKPKFEIPIRKERGPTDILEALSRTIKRDPTAPHYKYHDDPHFIPLSTPAKRSYALAQEAGRKAAMWIRETHADLFQHRVADPVIEAFLPKAVYEKKEDVNEEILKSVIMNGHVTDALTIYKLLREETTIDTKQSLFELLCYNNNTMPYSKDLLDENWYRKVEKYSRWKNSPDIDTLFAFLKEQDIKIATDAYNTMICATSKYMKVDRALELYDEAQKKQIPLYLQTYNHLITTIPLYKESAMERQKLLFEMLRNIKDAKLQPDTNTLNSALRVAVSIYHTHTAKDLCRSLFTEFKYIGVKPSLASYFHALKIFYRKHVEGSSLLTEIIDEIEGQEFDICDPTDPWFFIFAMEIAMNIEDSVLGDRIHKLLLTGKNYDFLIDGHKESVYYRSYVTLQLKTKLLDDFVQSCYNLIVPNVYIPESSVMEAILNAVMINDSEVSTSFLPQLWTHMVQFRFLEKKNLVSKALTLMRTHCKPPEDSPINNIFSDAAWTVWEYVMFQQTKQNQSVTWNGPILANIAILLLRGGEFDKCMQIISYFYNEQNSIVEVPELSQIQELLEACIRHGYPDAAIDLVCYCSEMGIDDVQSMSETIERNLPLKDRQKHRLKQFVGSKVLKIPTETEN